MDPKDITFKPDEPEAPGSTPEDVLKALMRDQNSASDSDGLTNPELEQLVDTLSTELDQGLLENLSGVTATAPLTLEELASAQAAAPKAAETLRTDYGEAVRCGYCGHNNSPSTLLCAMCGSDLRSPDLGSPSAIGADLTKEVRQTRPQISPAPAEIRKLLAEAVAKPAPDRMTVVLLVLLLVLLAVVIAQQWSLWRGPLSADSNRGVSDGPQPALAGSHSRPSNAAGDSRPGIPDQRPRVHSRGPAAVSSKGASKPIPELSPKTARNEKLRLAENETESMASQSKSTTITLNFKGKQ